MPASVASLHAGFEQLRRRFASAQCHASVDELREVSSRACALAHQAATAAKGFATSCQGANGSDALADRAGDAFLETCDPTYDTPTPGLPWGQMWWDGTPGLDPLFFKSVEAQMSSAEDAVAAAAAAQAAAARAGQTSGSPSALPPLVVLERRQIGDDTAPSTASNVAKGVAAGATVGAIVGVLIGLVADAPFGGAMVGAMIGGVTGGISNKNGGNAS